MLPAPTTTQEHAGDVLCDFEDPQQPESPQHADPKGGSRLDGRPDHFKDAPHDDLQGGRVRLRHTRPHVCTAPLQPPPCCLCGSSSTRNCRPTGPGPSSLPGGHGRSDRQGWEGGSPTGGQPAEAPHPSGPGQDRPPVPCTCHPQAALLATGSQSCSPESPWLGSGRGCCTFQRGPA